MPDKATDCTKDTSRSDYQRRLLGIAQVVETEIDTMSPLQKDALMNRTQPEFRPANCIDAKAENALRLEFLMKQQFHAPQRSNASVLDLAGEAGHAALYSGIQSPLIGLAQLADKSLDTNLAKQLDFIPAPEEEQFGTARWHAQVLGGGAGMTLPFMATRSALKRSGLTLAARTEARVLAASTETTLLTSGKLFSKVNAAMIADGALTGFAYDFFLTPVQKNEGDFWTARRNHGLTGAATFGALTAGSACLKAVARPIARELVGAKRTAFDFTGGVLSGAPAGVVNTDVSARLTKGRWATGEERTNGAYTMAMAGAVLSTAHRIPGQDLPPVAERVVGRMNEGTITMVGGLGTRHRDFKMDVPESPIDSFLMGTEFTRIDLNIGGEQSNYYHRLFLGGPTEVPNEHMFFLLAEHAKPVKLILDREVTIQLDQSKTSQPPGKNADVPSTSARVGTTAGADAAAVIPSMNRHSVDIPASLGTVVGRVADGTIRLAAGRSDNMPHEVIHLGSTSASNVDLGSHFSRLTLNIRGQAETYFRSKVTSSQPQLKANQFYILAQGGLEGPKLIRDHEVYLERNTGKEGMPTIPLSDYYGGVGTSAARTPWLTPTRGSLDPTNREEVQSNKDKIDPNVGKFKPVKTVKDFGPPRANVNFTGKKFDPSEEGYGAHTKDFEVREEPIPITKPKPKPYIYIAQPIPQTPDGTTVIGRVDGRNVRMSSENLGRGLPPDIIFLDVDQVPVEPGIPGFKSFYLDVSGKKVEYFSKKSDDRQFYKLDLSEYDAPKLIRDYQVFLEPEPQLTGTSHVPDGYYLKNRWRPAQDPIIPKHAEGVVVGKFGDRTVRLLKGLGQDLKPETIVVYDSRSAFSRAPVQKVILNVEGEQLEYYQFTREPGRFYRLEPTKSTDIKRLVRDFQIYLEPR